MAYNLFGHLDALARALEQQRSERKVLKPLHGILIPPNFVVREYTSNFRYALVFHKPLRTEKWVSISHIKGEGMAIAYYDAYPLFIPISKMNLDD